MNKCLDLVLGLVLCAFTAYAVEDVASAIEGTVKKVDAAGKTIVGETADGTERTFRLVGRTAVHGAEWTAQGTKETFHGLKEGSMVVVHYTAKGTEETAEEIDHIGKGGLKAMAGTVKGIDRGAKMIVVRAADGAEETFRLTERAARDRRRGREIREGDRLLYRGGWPQSRPLLQKSLLSTQHGAFSWA